MSAAGASSGTAVPRLPRGVRLRRDARGAWVLLGPERVVELDESAHAVLARCDGSATVAAISTALAREHGAELATVAEDVRALVEALAARRLLELA